MLFWENFRRRLVERRLVCLRTRTLRCLSRRTQRMILEARRSEQADVPEKNALNYAVHAAMM